MWLQLLFRNQEIGFISWCWKSKFQEDFELKFNFPHFEDVLPIKSCLRHFLYLKKKMSFPCWIELNMLSSMWKLLIICLHLVLGYVLSMILLVIVSFFNRIAQLVNNANVFEDSKMVMIIILLNFNYNKEKCFSIL